MTKYNEIGLWAIAILAGVILGYVVLNYVIREVMGKVFELYFKAKLKFWDEWGEKISNPGQYDDEEDEFYLENRWRGKKEKEER